MGMVRDGAESDPSSRQRTNGKVADANSIGMTRTNESRSGYAKYSWKRVGETQAYGQEKRRKYECVGDRRFRSVGRRNTVSGEHNGAAHTVKLYVRKLVEPVVGR